MSFYKITDPKERRRMFEKLSQTRKNVREQFLEEKIGDIESRESLKKIFKPVTESQRELAEGIKEQLEPIRDKVLALPLPAPVLPIEEGEEELTNIGPIVAEYLKKQTDKTFGPYTDKDGAWKIGNKKFTIDGNDLIIEGEKYPGTRGLWELLVLKKPSKENYNNDDLTTYSNIMIKTNSMRSGNDPNNPRPKSSRGWKWTNIVGDIWHQYKDQEGEVQGTGAVVLPCDPNALIERLDLLMASRDAGNTGTRNELVSICDELLRQKIISKNEYKNIMLRL